MFSYPSFHTTCGVPSGPSSTRYIHFVVTMYAASRSIAKLFVIDPSSGSTLMDPVAGSTTPTVAALRTTNQIRPCQSTINPLTLSPEGT